GDADHGLRALGVEVIGSQAAAADCGSASATRLTRCSRAPVGRCAADERDELAPFHSITSSASASNLSGICTPRAFAVFKLITNSNLVDCSTGRSAGFAPFRIFPV